MQIHVYEIDNNPFQPRRDFDEAAIAELCDSLQGARHDPAARRPPHTATAISSSPASGACGPRSRPAGSTCPPRFARPTTAKCREVAIVENLQRKDLNPLEKAASFQQYLERYGCTQEELAGRLKIDRSTIANLIRLLELPEAIQQSIRSGTIYARATPGPCCRWATSASSSPSASAFKTSRSACERPRSWCSRPSTRPTTSRWPCVGGDDARAATRHAPQQATQCRGPRARAAHGAGHQGGPQTEGRRPRPDRDPLQQSRRIRAAARSSYAARLAAARRAKYQPQRLYARSPLAVAAWQIEW